MISMIDTVIEKGQIYMTRISNWKNKVDMNIDVGPYLLKVAQTKKEVLGCFELRYNVFYKELAEKTNKSKLDYDQYDAHCDHLIIVHQPTQKIVGTYRMNFSETSSQFYTESEFQIDEWVQQRNHAFVELGRACIHAQHRRGAVLGLLWRGIAEYMQKVEAHELVGCSSLKLTDAKSAALIYKYFESQNFLHHKIFIPQPEFQMKDFLFWTMVYSAGLSTEQVAEAEKQIPSLLKSYIKAGAKVCSYPALDRDFACIDFMTILEREELDQRMVRKFNLN